MPSTVSFSEEAFLKYRDAWKAYRSLGHYDGESWVSPLSFKEAMEMPREMLEVFQELDFFLEQMKKQMKARQSPHVKENIDGRSR